MLCGSTLKRTRSQGSMWPRNGADGANEGSKKQHPFLQLSRINLKLLGQKVSQPQESQEIEAYDPSGEALAALQVQSDQMSLLRVKCALG